MKRARPAWWTVPNLVTAIRFALIAPIVALLLWRAQPLGAAMVGVVLVMVALAPGCGAVLPIGQAGVAVGALLHIGAGIGYLRRLLR